jgi:DNA-binding MarR family transcriptional regulator
MSKPSHEPEADLAPALAGDIRVFAGTLKRRLRELANPGDLSWSQVAVLGRLERDGPATVTTLARAEGVRPQSMGATISGLIEAGLVSSAPDPHDGRQSILSITAKCRQRIRAGREAREDWLLRTIRAKLPRKEQEELAAAVRLLKRLIEP